jgi:PAS domain S-box-containing protein
LLPGLQKRQYRFSKEPKLKIRGAAKLSWEAKGQTIMGDQAKTRKPAGETQMRFPSLLEDLEVGIAVVGPNTEALIFNDAAVELLGLTRNELAGRPAYEPSWDVIHEDGSPFSAEEHPSAVAIRTKLPVHSVVAGVFRPLHGDRKWLVCNAVPHLDEDETVRYVVCSFSDISKRKLAEEALATAHDGIEKQARLLDLAQDAIVVRDLDGTITYLNQGAANKYGWTKEEAAGKITHELLRTKFSESAEEVMRKLLAEGYWEGEVAHTRRDGRQITVFSRQVLENSDGGQPQSVLEINRDITERKEMEQKLRENEESLHRLSGHLLQSQDEERRRISRELHDTASQILTALLTRLHIVAKSTTALGHPAQQALSESLELATSATNFIRTFASGLHPPILDEKGLAAAIRWYADGVSPQGTFRIEIESPQEIPRLAQQAERSLYRIAQESIARIRVLAESAIVHVRLSTTAKELALEVWGPGGSPSIAGSFPAGAAEMNFGAAGMRERMRQLAGSLEIRASNSGTLIRAVLPLAQHANSVVRSSIR